MKTTKLTHTILKLIFLFVILIQCSKKDDIIINSNNNNDIGVNDPPGDVIQLSNKREIFVDYYLIDKLEGAEIISHAPKDEGPVIYFDEPWEGTASTYVTIIKDEFFYRAYYRGKGCYCYAESEDGINWVKPNLKLIEVNKSNENNVFLNIKPFEHNFTPFIDKRPGIPKKERFKAISGQRTDHGDVSGGLYAFASEDGIHWSIMNNGVPVFTHNPVLHGSHAFDSQNVSFWSEEEKCYLLYFRHWTTHHGQLRSIGRATSEDFLNWSDESGTFKAPNMPGEELYTNQTSPYFRAPHIYLAIGARFDLTQVLTKEQLDSLKVAKSQYMGISEPYFMSARGGGNYERTFMDAFIRPGLGANNWSARTNYPALNVVQTGRDEMSVYVNHDYTQPTAHLRRFSMRLDGFSSLYGSNEGGEVITKPFIFSGSKLEINYSTSIKGEIKIEIQDAHGKPLPGFTMGQTEVIIGNEIAKVVKWSGDLNDLASKPIRLKIYLKNADLFSLKFS